MPIQSKTQPAAAARAGSTHHALETLQRSAEPAQHWPADRTERRSTAELIPYARNSRTHSEAQIKQIAASIREWGWTSPVLIRPDGTVIAGHARLRAAELLGLESVPVMIAQGWSEARARAYVIADNRLALDAGWDEELLKLELEEIKGLDDAFDLTITGFGEEEIKAFLETPDFSAGLEEHQGDLGTLTPKLVVCPHCGKSFDLNHDKTYPEG